MKTNSKWIKDLNVRPETIKEIGSNLFDIVLTKMFLDRSPQARKKNYKGLYQSKRVFAKQKKALTKEQLPELKIHQ